MPDESARPLPAPSTAVDGYNLTRTDIAWFDGNKRRVDRYYVADGRIAALGEQKKDDAGSASVYGEWADGIVTRATQDPPSRFVSGEWLSEADMAGQTLLSQALAQFLPMLDGAAPLQIDDRSVLGLDDALADASLDAEHWAVAVAGELVLPGLAEQLPLRPAVVVRDGDMLSFEEPGGMADGEELVLEMTLTADGALTGPTVTLNVRMALLQDEKLDGAWERAAPLWLPTGTGLLRIDQGEEERAPYLFFSESRSIEARRWFPEISGAGSARLMLDQSGAKKLTLQLEDKAVAMTLRVAQPALVFILPEAAVDGRALPAPRLPPGAGARARAADLHMVPVHLCGASKSAWSLAYDEGMELTWARPSPPDSAELIHFTGFQNWVRPPEAARNESPGISPLRTLIPMLPDGKLQRFDLRMTDSGLSVTPLDTFATMAPEATAFGPLASFDAQPGRASELWPGGVAAVVPEPAVLRAAYRTLPPGVASAGAPASFATTRVHPDAPARDTDLARSSVTDAEYAQHRGWATRANGTSAQRDEHRTEWPGARFGWMDRQFLTPGAIVDENSPAPNAALAWGELRGDAPITATRWARLGDDSLARLPDVTAATRVDALAALAQADILLDTFTLEDMSSQGGWGLAHLRVSERVGKDGSNFTIQVGTAADVVTFADRHGVNRIVVADAHIRQVQVGLDPAATTSALNRIYLELERRGPRLVVARGMLGWSASAAFGLPKKGSAADGPDFHLTERFERVDDVLVRSVEYNGALTRQMKGNHVIDLFFWDAVQAPGATTLRVICHYQLKETTAPDSRSTSICAVQDAALVGSALDLSADVAIMQTAGGASATPLANPWDPDRRKLFRLLFDTKPALYLFAGFLCIRMADNDRVDVRQLNPSDAAPVVPAWFLSDRDLIPWFDSDSALPAPNRASWTSSGLLRTRAAASGKSRLSLQLRSVAVVKWEQCYASTLIGSTHGLPLWVPSPVRVPSEADEAAVGPNVAGLWLFDPGPRRVAQWLLPAGVDVAAQRAQAEQQAMQRLWRMGWTREAVLELPAAAPDNVTWLVIDSPLLNRSASLAWFGWPLAPGAQYPSEELPSTTQVPQTRQGEQQSYSLQVAFEHDAPFDQAGLHLVFDSGQPSFDVPAIQTQGAPPSMRGGGLRAGVQHRLVVYGLDQPIAEVAPDRLEMPAPQKGAALMVRDGLVAWLAETVDLAPTQLAALANDVVLYVFPYQCSAVRISGAASGLQWQSGPERGWVAVEEGAWLTLPTAAPGNTSIQLKLPALARWSALSVTLRGGGAAMPDEVKTLFPADGTRLAGVFDSAGTLLAFGEERAFYLAPERAPGTPPDQGLTAWTRYRGVELAPHQAAAVTRVVTIDLDGRTLVSAV